MAVNIKKGRSGALDFTPMIDMVFNLLIFFLVATRFEEEERSLDVTLPSAAAAVPLTVRPKELVVNIDRSGRYFVQRRETTVQELAEILRDASSSNPGRQTVLIRADKQCPWQFVVTAMDLCNKAGIRDYRPAMDSDAASTNAPGS
jgi:biopolymer transport protein ExbD